MSKALPKNIFVYVSDYFDGVPIYGVTTDIDEIPETIDGETVGVYALQETKKLSVERSLR